MDNSLILDPTAEEAKQFRQQFTQRLAEMDRLFDMMARDQEDIDRLKTRSLATLAEIRAVSEQTDAILATLKVA